MTEIIRTSCLFKILLGVIIFLTNIVESPLEELCDFIGRYKFHIMLQTGERIPQPALSGAQKQHVQLK